MKQIAIRQWRLSDAGELAAAISNERVLRNLRDGIPYPYTERDAAYYINAMAEDPHKNLVFAVCYDGNVVGNVGAFRQENIHCRTAELGYYVAEAYWGRGIATEAVRLLCAHVFGSTDILRIFAEPFADNAASCRVLEKVGFQYEGTMRSNAVKGGRVRDMRLYALLKDEARREEMKDK
ncbi:MAG: GNAT family N-acetyltransferase [Treponemataceae bacterium]|nr:GNAT family N-acetyltransferase [Treponemataceae bacterium]